MRRFKLEAAILHLILRIQQDLTYFNPPYFYQIKQITYNIDYRIPFKRNQYLDPNSCTPFGRYIYIYIELGAEGVLKLLKAQNNKGYRKYQSTNTLKYGEGSPPVDVLFLVSTSRNSHSLSLFITFNRCLLVQC